VCHVPSRIWGGGGGAVKSLKLKLIYDRQSVGQPVLVSGSHLEPMTRFFYLSDDCRFPDMGHPLWWEGGSVICLYSCFWALPEQSLLGRSPIELMTILIWDCHNLWGQVPVYVSPRNRVAQLYPPDTGFPFCRLLWLAGLWWRYSNLPPHGEEGDLSTVSYIGIQFVPHRKFISFPLQIQPGHWGPITIHYRLIWDCVPSSLPLTTCRVTVEVF
jgi:hypothetical protein